MAATDRTRRYVKPALAVVRVAACLALGLVLAPSRGTAIEMQNASLEQQAFQAAAKKVAASVVRIDTIGGLEQVDGMLVGSGATTGLIVDPDGWIISSAFNFINKPTSILVRLPDGGRKSAKVVATDHARKLVLLKVEAERPLPVCETASQAAMRVGQWTIALGRTFDSDRPNLAVGILSAVDRVWGKALQTDAAVSPNNYGGPLVDVHGRVMGVLVPLSPNSTEEIGGVEWYDSGIGFAIPMEHVQKILPRLKKGEDLYPGIAGISLKTSNPITGEPVVGACHPKSSAAAEGLRAGDRILEVDGRAIRRAADFKIELGRHYAGDSVQIALLRGKERMERRITLTDKLVPYQHGFLGVLPERTAGGKGIKVRFVYPHSPAAKAGIRIGDQLESLDKQVITGRLGWITKIGGLEPGSKVTIGIQRDGKPQEVTVTLAALPDGLPPGEVPEQRAEPKQGKPGANVGPVAMKLPEYPNEVWAYVPENYSEEIPCGVVVFLHKPGSYDWKELLASWKPLCDRYRLILVAPKSGNQGYWTPDEAELVDRLLVEVDSAYNVDPARVVVHGFETGGTLASLAAFRNREVVRGLAVVEGPLMGTIPENDPLHRLSIYLAWSKKSPASRALARAEKTIEQAKIPLTVKDLGETPRHLGRDELAELARWIDALDRI